MIIRSASKGLGVGRYDAKRSDMFRDTFYPGLGFIELESGVGRRQKGARMADWDIGMGDAVSDVTNAIKSILPDQIAQAPALITGKLDEIKLALQISTAASILAATMAFLAYSGGRR